MSFEVIGDIHGESTSLASLWACSVIPSLLGFFWGAALRTRNVPQHLSAI